MYLICAGTGVSSAVYNGAAAALACSGRSLVKNKGIGAPGAQGPRGPGAQGPQGPKGPGAQGPRGLGFTELGN